MKKAVIIGAYSGIGNEVAKILIDKGGRLGIAARRLDKLDELKAIAPDRIKVQIIDVTSTDAPANLQKLIDELGGMGLFFLSSGIGYQNMNLDPELEIKTVQTNGEGFVRMTTAAFNYFKTNNGGHLAIISSIAGTKGLGVAPAYSATKRFQNIYIDALEQLSNMQNLGIRFTDIRPGFVKTNLLNDGKHYPLLMSPDKVAQDIVKALEHKKRIVVIDWRYRLLVFGWRLIPRFIWKNLSIKTT